MITRLYNEWEAAKYKKDDEGGATPSQPDEDGAVRRKKGAPRKMPTLPSQGRKG